MLDRILAHRRYPTFIMLFVAAAIIVVGLLDAPL